MVDTYLFPNADGLKLNPHFRPCAAILVKGLVRAELWGVRYKYFLSDCYTTAQKFIIGGRLKSSGKHTTVETITVIATNIVKVPEIHFYKNAFSWIFVRCQFVSRVGRLQPVFKFSAMTSYSECTLKASYTNFYLQSFYRSDIVWDKNCSYLMSHRIACLTANRASRTCFAHLKLLHAVFILVVFSYVHESC